MYLKLRSSILAILLLVAGMQTATGQQLERRPYLQNLKTDSVEILWRTDLPVPSWVEFRERGTEERIAYISTIPRTVHQMLLPGLRPDTFYEYRIGTGEKVLSEPVTFQTFAPPGTSQFEFVAYGDHRNNPQAHRSVVDAILQMSEKRGLPRFVLDTGDYTGQGEHETDFWNEQFFDPAWEMMKQVCLFPVIGNHESGTRWPRIPFRYLQNFSVPVESSGTRYYYSFDFGTAHFTMIDVFASKFDPDSKQYAWIREDLRTTEQPWKFAVMHYPIFIHRTAPSVSYGNQEIRDYLVPLFEKYGVTAVISGDSHFYQRSEVNGIHYICSGGGGAPLYTPGSGQPYVRASHEDFHYTWFVISGDEMTMYAYDHENQLIDFFSTAPRQPQLPEPPELNHVRRLPDGSLSPREVYILESRDSDGNPTLESLYEETGTMHNSVVKSRAEGLRGTGSRFSDNQDADTAFRFTPPIELEGTYLISITSPSASSVNAPNTLFEVHTGEEVIRGRVAITAEVTGDRWYDIGLFELSPGDFITFMEVMDEPDRFYADAIRLIRYD